MREPKTIGVFDSGVGGLTVVRALRQRFPQHNICYLGDTARVPYGSKSPRTVERYALACTRFLLERDVSLVLIACNTASATALPAVSASSPIPVIGAVGPGARAAIAATPSGRIGVLGTLATIQSGAYEDAIEALAPQAEVQTRACPLFVPLVEEGWSEGEIAEKVALRYLAPLYETGSGPDTLVLGCTHYPLLASVVQRAANQLAGRPIQLVDSASSMAEEAGEYLTKGEGPVGQLAIHVTDATRIDELAPRFLGEEIHRVELVDL